MKHLQSIQEITYLSVLNAPQYRRIMRIFYEEYEKMCFQLYKEDIYEKLIMYEDFKNYTMDQLKLDLQALVTWKNLTPIQDPKKVYTISDYKNKQYRYTMSEYAVEIERLTVKLENLFMEGGNLSTNLFARIYESLEKCDEISLMTSKGINEWWHNLQEDFKRLNQSYQDYLREFYTGRSEKVLKSVEFILHKDRLITYLQEFIQELQLYSAKIEESLSEISKEEEQHLLEKVIVSELEIPHPLSEKQDHLENYIRENIYGKWDALKHWFKSYDGRPSDSMQVMEITDEVIRKIIQNAALLVQLQNWGISRKDDYKKFIQMFLDCETMGDAHKLAAYVFGIQHIRHVLVNDDRSTDSINNSTYDEEPTRFLLKPRTRSYHEKVDKTGFKNKSMEKVMQRNAYLAQMKDEKEMVLKYIHENRLDISEIKECVSVNTRETLLRWIAAANANKSQKGHTEYGQSFKLIRKKSRCTLCCEDGDLEMPVYVLEFEGEANE